MEMQNVEQGKVIGNVGSLDLRKATEASIAEISRIGNVGAVLYSPETAHLVARLNMGNVGASVEVPEDAKMLAGLLRHHHLVLAADADRCHNHLRIYFTFCGNVKQGRNTRPVRR